MLRRGRQFSQLATWVQALKNEQASSADRHDAVAVPCFMGPFAASGIGLIDEQDGVEVEYRVGQGDAAFDAAYGEIEFADLGIDTDSGLVQGAEMIGDEGAIEKAYVVQGADKG